MYDKCMSFGWLVVNYGKESFTDDVHVNKFVCERLRGDLINV